MSTCISRHGEFGWHELDDNYVCKLCAVIDEDALIAELNRLRAQSTSLAQAKAGALRAFADGTRTTEVLYRRDNGSGVTVNDLLRETAARYLADQDAPAGIGTPAYRCETCHGTPRWRILRRGDALVTWACGHHLPAACDGLQRDHEHTELVVTRMCACPWTEEHEQGTHTCTAVANHTCPGPGCLQPGEPAQPDRQP